MKYNFLKTDDSHPEIQIITISLPKSLNALNRYVLQELDDAVSKLDESVRVLVITGDGEKSFVAGADISQMSNFNEQEAYEFSKSGSTIFKKIEDLPIPVIAAVNGFALGGGCELALACDIRVATHNALFGQPEVKLGIIPGFSGTYRLVKLLGEGLATELIYTGISIKAEEALRVGWVNSVVPNGHLLLT